MDITNFEFENFQIVDNDHLNDFLFKTLNAGEFSSSYFQGNIITTKKHPHKAFGALTINENNIPINFPVDMTNTDSTYTATANFSITYADYRIKILEKYSHVGDDIDIYIKMLLYPEK